MHIYKYRDKLTNDLLLNNKSYDNVKYSKTVVFPIGLLFLTLSYSFYGSNLQ